MSGNAENIYFRRESNLSKWSTCREWFFGWSFCGHFGGCFGHCGFLLVILGRYLVIWWSFWGVFWSFFPYGFKGISGLSRDKSVLERFKMRFEEWDLRRFGFKKSDAVFGGYLIGSQRSQRSHRVHREISGKERDPRQEHAGMTHEKTNNIFNHIII